eukprot:TRINITY_DN1035_c0_g1_i1.p1 TRINITY_DN1035_c0_g1~~TRINITY_DN1035_c0_g1_i1.p1  ORF type:complete len:360 (+),score=96.02 TRINITY_DN1035_c0_g1_i1:181-1260(+)
MYAAVFIALLAVASAQTDLTLAAAGAIPSGGSAQAGGVGTGEDVVGEAVIGVTEQGSISGVTMAATGSSSPTPAASPSPSPSPAPAPSTPSTSTATAVAAATASGPGASASADATANVGTITMTKPAPKKDEKKGEDAAVVYYTQLVEKKPEPTCADVKDETCPAMAEFDNCGYCIIQKYPLVGYGCPVEKYLVKKDGSKGEYEVVTKPLCDCPEGALYIDDINYCPSCDLALMELLVCSGVKEMPEDISAVEIKAECLEKVQVTTDYLEECGFIKPEPKDVVVTMKDPKEKEAKKYVVADPEEEKKEKEAEPKKYMVVEPTPAAKPAAKPAPAPTPAPTPATGLSAVATATATASVSG